MSHHDSSSSSPASALAVICLVTFAIAILDIVINHHGLLFPLGIALAVVLVIGLIMIGAGQFLLITGLAIVAFLFFINGQVAMAIIAGLLTIIAGIAGSKSGGH